MIRVQCSHSYNTIISLENLLAAWKEFLNGKRSRSDVHEFSSHLMPNIIALHAELESRTYKHSLYKAFSISDPKPRRIHKAGVRDRLLHHAIHRVLYPFFVRVFIADSFSCRLQKGTHKAVDRFQVFSRKVSCNHTRTVWVLKCDIRKFFASVDQGVLVEILKKYIPDINILRLLTEIIGSFHSTKKGVGLPLGNLTSQLLVNIYMNEFDQFVKHKLKVKYYIRYADDFAIFSPNKLSLQSLIPEIQGFLNNRLKLDLHPDKISIGTIVSGIDYLGWVHFPDHRVLRTTTKRRMMQQIERTKGKNETVQSYLGVMSHGNSRGLRNRVEKLVERYKEEYDKK
jgi:RNA-directed DNA polymerase